MTISGAQKKRFLKK